jgi:hypothetical protein
VICNGSPVLFTGSHGPFNHDVVEVSPFGIAKDFVEFASAPVFSKLLIFMFSVIPLISHPQANSPTQSVLIVLANAITIINLGIPFRNHRQKPNSPTLSILSENIQNTR